MRILIVEDEKRIQDFLSRGLESAGYAVDVAADGNTARARSREFALRFERILCGSKSDSCTERPQQRAQNLAAGPEGLGIGLEFVSPCLL